MTCVHKWEYSSIIKKEVCVLCDKIGHYELRNRTQMLIMKEIVWLHDLIFMKGQVRFWNDWFRLKSYLFKKYKISF